MEDFDDKSSN